MANCRDLLAELSNYLDGEIGTDLRRDLEAHLSQCSTCRVLLDSTKKSLRIITASRSFELPEAVSERLTARLMEIVRRDAECDLAEPADPT